VAEEIHYFVAIFKFFNIIVLKMLRVGPSVILSFLKACGVIEFQIDSDLGVWLLCKRMLFHSIL